MHDFVHISCTVLYTFVYNHQNPCTKNAQNSSKKAHAQFCANEFCVEIFTKTCFVCTQCGIKVLTARSSTGTRGPVYTSPWTPTWTPTPSPWTPTPTPWTPTPSPGYRYDYTTERTTPQPPSEGESQEPKSQEPEPGHESRRSWPLAVATALPINNVSFRPSEK